MKNNQKISIAEDRREILYKRIPGEHILPAILFLIIEGVLSPTAFSDTWQVQLTSILAMAIIACFFIYRFFPAPRKTLKHTYQIDEQVTGYSLELQNGMPIDSRKAIEESESQKIELKKLSRM